MSALDPLVTISVKVPRSTADRLGEIAAQEYRSTAAELRRLINERIDEEPRLEKVA